MSDVPNGYARVTPYLLYADATTAREFLERAFGFEEVAAERQVDGAGRMTHTALRLIDQVVLIGSPGPRFAGPAPSPCGG